MPTFDLKTIIFMSMLLTFMLSMLLGITRAHHKDVKGPGYWAIGNLVIGLGLVILFSKFSDGQWQIMPGIALVGAGLAMFVNGIQAFSGKRVIYLFPLLVGLLLLILNGYLIVFDFGIQYILICNAVVFGYIYLMGVRLTFGKASGLVGNLYWTASSLYFMMALLMTARVITTLFMSDGDFVGFLSWPVNAYTFMLACIVQFFVSVLFVLMLTAQVNQDLESMATVDGLTNVLNRRGLQDSALKMQSICKRIDIPMSLLLIDLDYFKKVNDTFGHLAGDEVLIVIAQTIKDALRGGDIVGRYGGEEFCVLLPNTSENEALALARRIRTTIEEKEVTLLNVKKSPNTPDHLSCTVSIGVSSTETAGNDVQKMMAAADSALYSAKNSGRNLVASVHGVLKRENQSG